jgi:hypothetical protein
MCPEPWAQMARPLPVWNDVRRASLPLIACELMIRSEVRCHFASKQPLGEPDPLFASIALIGEQPLTQQAHGGPSSIAGMNPIPPAMTHPAGTSKPYAASRPLSSSSRAVEKSA